MSQILIQMVPSDIANIILEFTGYHKRRNGQYMPQILRTTKSYRAIKRLFNRIVKNGIIKQGFAVLNVSPLTKYIVFDSHAVSNGRL
jgi:hypothetical protein